MVHADEDKASAKRAMAKERMDPSLSLVIGKIGEKLLSELARQAGRTLHGTPIERAIGAVQGEFGPDVVIDNALTAWCQATAFRELLEHFVAGRRDLSRTELAASFIEHGGFYHPDADELHPFAERVVERFLMLLEAELLASPKGLAVVAGRQEALADEIRRDIDQVPGRVVEALTGSLGRSVADVRGGGDPGLQAQVDAARDLLNAGHPTGARTILEGVVAKLPELPNAELEFRVETNLGAAALSLDDLAEARARFASALRLKPTSSRALANMSQLELLEGRSSQALELAQQAWGTQPDSHSAVAMLLALQNNGMRHEVEQFAIENAWLDSDPSGVAVLGQIDLDSERFPQAVDRLRRATEADPGNPKLLVQLAVALTREAQSGLRDEPPLSWRMATEDRGALAEAETLLTQAANTLAPREPRGAYLEAVALRAGLRTMVGRSAEAMADAERVLVEDPQHAGALQAKGIALLRTDAIAAVEHLEAARDALGNEIAVSQALAHAYEQADRLADAAQVLSTIRATVVGQRDEIDIAGALMRVHWRAEQYDDARAIEAELERAWSDDPHARLILARFAEVRGDDDAASRLMRQALDAASGALQDRISVEMAEFSIERGQFAEAAELLETVIEDSAPLEFRQRYTLCLFNAGRLKDALAFAQRQRGSGPSIPIITDVEAEILERISDARGARGLWEKIADEQPQRIGALLRATSAAHGHGDSVVARKLLKRVDERTIRDDATLLMQLAQLRTVLKEPAALPPAYRARRLEFGNPKMHLAYIGVFLWRGDQDAALLEANVVDRDTTVRLTKGERSEVLTIEDEDPVAAQGEIGWDDPVAQRLIGHRVGESIVMKSGGIEELTYEIAEIKSKYVQAFQETVGRYSTLFPDHPGIETIQISEGDLTQFLRALDLQSEHAAEVLKLYTENHIPVAMVARLLGRRQIDVWRGLWSAADVPIFVSTGKGEDRTQELTVAGGKGIVLDLSAVVTVDELELWAPLRGLYERVVVPQAVVDEIRDHAREYDRMKPTGYAAKVGDRFVMQDVSPEQLASEQARLRALLSRIEDEMEVVGAPGLLELAPDELRRLGDALGDASLAAAHIARQEGLALYADDLGLRQLAASEWNVDGTWTQPVLATARQRKLIEVEAYRAALARLAEWRFHVVELSADDLVALLAVEGAPEAPTSVRVAGFAFGKDFLDAYAVHLAADVIKGLWVLPLIGGRRHLLLALVLSSLVRGRDSRQTIAALLQVLSPRVRLLVNREEIVGSVAVWGRERAMHED